MVLSYLLASTLTMVRGRSGGGNLLVLGSANVDECLRGKQTVLCLCFQIGTFVPKETLTDLILGYLTKYDCSSSDLNPIGSISKADLVRYLRFAKVEYKLDVLEKFLNAVPTAELEPITETYTQSDVRVLSPLQIDHLLTLWKGSRHGLHILRIRCLWSNEKGNDG